MCVEDDVSVFHYYLGAVLRLFLHKCLQEAIVRLEMDVI